LEREKGSFGVWLTGNQNFNLMEKTVIQNRSIALVGGPEIPSIKADFQGTVAVEVNHGSLRIRNIPLEAHNLSGVRILANSQVVVQGSVVRGFFTGPQNSGIMVEPGASLTMEGSHLLGFLGDGIQVAGKATIKGSRIFSNGENGVIAGLVEGGSGVVLIENSVISGNGIGDSAASFTKECGLVLDHGSMGTIQNSLVSFNNACGIQVVHASSASITNSQITFNGAGEFKSGGVVVGDTDHPFDTDQSDVNLMLTTILNNNTGSGLNEAIDCSATSTVKIEGSILLGSGQAKNSFPASCGKNVFKSVLDFDSEISPCSNTNTKDCNNETSFEAILGTVVELVVPEVSQLPEATVPIWIFRSVKNPAIKITSEKWYPTSDMDGDPRKGLDTPGSDVYLGE